MIAENRAVGYLSVMDLANFSDDEIMGISDFFKVFGDPTRLRLLIILDARGEMGVSAIAEALSMSQSAISQQLKMLRASRLVKFRKDGRSAIYRLSDDHIHRILALGIEHYEELL